VFRPLCLLTFALVVACLAHGLSGRVRAELERTPRVFIAAGWFTMGASVEDLGFARKLCVSERMPTAIGLRGCASDELFSHETPARRVYLRAYWLDRYEVSRAELAACVRTGGCSPPEYVIAHPGLSLDSHPASGMAWSGASALCRQRGGRLPTEAEWERAARGDSARRFPWGSAYNEALANHGGPALSFDPSDGRPSSADGYAFAAPVRAFAQAASAHGVVQMAGNVWEWTADHYAPLAAQTTRVDPVQTLGSGPRVVRGGSFRAPAFALRVTHREPRAESHGFADVGVRCAYDPL
jgi:formylglycine-generating enzyme required for sulfatase activity